MKNKIIILTALTVFLFPALLGAASLDMQEGLWEITTTMEMPGMPHTMQPMTQTQCITKDDLQNDEKVIPRSSDECRLIDHNIAGNKVTWKVECNEGSGTGEITYRNNSYEGSLRMVMRGEGGGQQVTMRFKGRRIGDCR